MSLAAWPGATVRDACPAEHTIAAAGAARLAAAMHGWPIERVAWLVGPDDAMPPPSERASGQVARCIVDTGVLDHVRDAFEERTLREVTDGARGVQLLDVSAQWDDGSRELSGARARIVRIYDRAAGTGVALAIGDRRVATIGAAALDLAALDRFDRYANARLAAWPGYDFDRTRALVAQLAAIVDPGFADSAAWPETTSPPPRPAAAAGYTHVCERRFASGAREVTCAVSRFRPAGAPRETGWVRTRLAGLPWGMALAVDITDDDATSCTVQLCTTIALAERVVAAVVA